MGGKERPRDVRLKTRSRLRADFDRNKRLGEPQVGMLYTKRFSVSILNMHSICLVRPDLKFVKQRRKSKATLFLSKLPFEDPFKDPPAR